MNTKATLLVQQIGDNTRIRLQNPNASEYMVRDLTSLQVHELIELLEKTKKMTFTPEEVGHIE